MSFSPPPLPPSYGPLQVWWEQVRGGLAESFTNIEGLIADLAATQAAADAAQADATQALSDAVDALAAAVDAASDAAAAATAAATAATAAATAQTTATDAATDAAAAQSTADAVKLNHAINTGNTIPGEVLTGTDAGSNATITIAAHTRRYGDKADVSVSGGSLTGRAYSTEYYVYYDQTSRAGGAVTYQSTTNWNTADPNKTAGRHFVGRVVTPAAAAPPTSGGSGAPAGGGEVSPGRIGVIA